MQRENRSAFIYIGDKGIGVAIIRKIIIYIAPEFLNALIVIMDKNPGDMSMFCSNQSVYQLPGTFPIMGNYLGYFNSL